MLDVGEGGPMLYTDKDAEEEDEEVAEEGVKGEEKEDDEEKLGVDEEKEEEFSSFWRSEINTAWNSSELSKKG